MSLIAEISFLLLDWRWLATGVLLFACSYVACFYKRTFKYPKGPFALPLLGSYLTLRKEKQWFQKCKEWSIKFGDPFTVWVVQEPMVIINSDHLVREAFISRKQDFSGRRFLNGAELRIGSHHNLLFEDYTSRTKALRKVLVMALRKHAVSETLETLCCDAVDAYVDSLKETPQLVRSSAPFEQIVFRVLALSCYGTGSEDANSDIAALLNLSKKLFVWTTTGSPGDKSPWLRLARLFRRSKDEVFVKDYLQILKKLYMQAQEDYIRGARGNLCHALLSAMNEAIAEEKDIAQHLIEGNIVQVLIDLFAAGTSSTVGQLHWLWLKIAMEPSIQAKIQKEIENNLGNAPPTFKCKMNLPYTSACLLEAERLYPILPLAIPHRTTCDTEAGGRQIPKHTVVLYNAYNLNRNPDVWKDPKIFKPERFLEPDSGRLCQTGLPQLATFGLGPRMCPADTWARTGMFYILVRLMQRLTISDPACASGGDISPLFLGILMNPTTQNILCTPKN